MPSDLSPFAIDVLSFAASHTLPDCLDELADHGCQAVQVSLHPGFLWPSEIDGAARETLRKHLVARGLRVASVNLPGVEINLASAYPEMRAYTIDVLRQNLQLAADLGAPAIVVAPGRPHPLIPAATGTLRDRFRAGLDVLLPLAERWGPCVCVENTPSSFACDVDALIAAVDSYGSDSLGICYDVPNGHFIGEDIATALLRIGSRLRLLHVADTGRDAHRHAAVGQGSVPFADIPEVLRKTGYGDRPILEIISANGFEDIASSARNLLHMGWATA